MRRRIAVSGEKAMLQLAAAITGNGDIAGMTSKSYNFMKKMDFTFPTGFITFLLTTTITLCLKTGYSLWI